MVLRNRAHCYSDYSSTTNYVLIVSSVGMEKKLSLYGCTRTGQLGRSEFLGNISSLSAIEKIVSVQINDEAFKSNVEAERKTFQTEERGIEKLTLPPVEPVLLCCLQRE